MPATILDPQHAALVNESIRPSLAYPVRLRERLVANGFTPDDKLYAPVSDAHNATHPQS